MSDLLLPSVCFPRFRDQHGRLRPQLLSPQSSAPRELVPLLTTPPGLMAGSGRGSRALGGDEQVAWVPGSWRDWRMKAEHVL